VRFSIIPRETKFFDLFESSAQNMVDIADALKDMVCSWGDIEKSIEHITDLEHKGDSITHEIVAQLHRTFVTPFDREDMATLAERMDDVTDLIHASADAMYIYKIKEPTERSKELANIIVQAAKEVAKAVPSLRQKSEMKKVLESCVELNRLENKADKAYRSALGELFEDSKDITHIIKWREIYEHMESATDRCEDVANVLEGVALKHA